VQGDFIIDNSQESAKKKRKTRHDEQERSDNTFYKKWVSFLDDAQSSKNLHKYSPEKNGVLRFAPKLAPRPIHGQ
jgi:hypothetical protein